MASDKVSNVLDDIEIREAEPNDCEEIVRLVLELAEFEKMADKVKMTADTFQRDCFGERPLCSCIVASWKSDRSRLVGYAVYCPTYSTWEGISLHLEDLYVTPGHRGKGLGRKLWYRVIQEALKMDCNRLSLSVLGWNKIAKDMYTRYGCVDITETEDQHKMRLYRQAMEDFVKYK